MRLYNTVRYKRKVEIKSRWTCNPVALQRKSPGAILARYNTLLRLFSTIHECTQQLIITASKGTVCC